MRVVVNALALCLLVAGCGDDDAPVGTTGTTSAAEPARAGSLTVDQRRRIDQLVSTFENSTTEIQYGYAENIDDGRGVTAGRSRIHHRDLRRPHRHRALHRAHRRQRARPLRARARPTLR